MSSTTDQNENAPAEGFAPEPEEMSLPAEFMLFLRENKKWWLLPIILMVAAIGVLLALSANAGAAAPFIYTLF